MSTFDGIVTEYPSITIDNFVTEQNYESTVYFLSHCHSDHMRGLRDPDFLEHLQSKNFKKIYVSKVSQSLLVNDDEYEHLTPFLEVLPIECPTLISVPNNQGHEELLVVVTLLPAGHCPGSVMFYFEGSNGNVLYTGDFRLPIESSRRLKALHYESGKLKPLHSMYVDTTFCDPNSLYIPNREECMSAITSIVKRWISKGKNHIVYFFCPAKYAYEFVFIELYNKFGVKTHVSEKKIKQYHDIDEISRAVTSVANEAQIHACIYQKNDLFRIQVDQLISPCGYRTPVELPIKVLEIRPSAQFFKHRHYQNIAQYDRFSGFYRVCYSTHSSLMEIRDLVHYLKPQLVNANVVGKNQTSEEVLKWLNIPILGHPKENDEVVPLLGSLKRKLDLPETTRDSLPFYDDTNQISPPKSIRRRIVTAITESTNDSKEKSDAENDLNNIGNPSPPKWEYPLLCSQEIEDASDVASDESECNSGCSQQSVDKAILDHNFRTESSFFPKCIVDLSSPKKLDLETVRLASREKEEEYLTLGNMLSLSSPNGTTLAIEGKSLGHKLLQNKAIKVPLSTSTEGEALIFNIQKDEEPMRLKKNSFPREQVSSNDPQLNLSLVETFNNESFAKILNENISEIPLICESKLNSDGLNVKMPKKNKKLSESTSTTSTKNLVSESPIIDSEGNDTTLNAVDNTLNSTTDSTILKKEPETTPFKNSVENVNSVAFTNVDKTSGSLNYSEAKSVDSCPPNLDPSFTKLACDFSHQQSSSNTKDKKTLNETISNHASKSIEFIKKQKPAFEIVTLSDDNSDQDKPRTENVTLVSTLQNDIKSSHQPKTRPFQSTSNYIFSFDAHSSSSETEEDSPSLIAREPKKVKPKETNSDKAKRCAFSHDATKGNDIFCAETEFKSLYSHPCHDEQLMEDESTPEDLILYTRNSFSSVGQNSPDVVVSDDSLQYFK